MTEMVQAVLNGEHEMWLPKHRADRPEWYEPLGWERERLRLLRQMIMAMANPVVYYVGAEEGEMAALCQMWGGRMVLFEPNPLVWPNIRQIWEANDLELPLASFVGFAAAETDLHPPKREPHSDLFIHDWPPCSVGDVITDHGFKELHSQADEYCRITIDEMVAAMGKQPGIITFDVEGAEWEVMKGAEKTLRERRPTLMASIHPEFMIEHYGQHSRDFRRWLTQLGYREQFVDYQHELHMLFTPK